MLEMDNKELRKLRLSLGFTQKQMATKLGIKHRMYCYVEAGIKPLSTASTMLAEQLKPTVSIEEQGISTR